MGFFDTLFGGGAEREAAEKNRAAYAQYGQLGTGYLDNGLAKSTGALNDAKSDFAPLSALATKYGQGTDMYLNALGLNGSGGTQAAQSAFTSSPGYDWQLGQGLDALNRRRAAGGMVNSGNADIDALTYGQGLAKQDYGSWLSNLSGINNNALSATGAAATGLAGVDTGLAGLYQTDATNRVGLQGNVTSGNAQANTLQAQGEAAGARNLLGAGLAIGQLAMGMPPTALGGGGSSGGGGSLSSLGGSFSFGDLMNPASKSTLGFNPLRGAWG